MSKAKRIAYYIRDTGNLHYLACIQPYLDHFLRQGVHRNHVVIHSHADDLIDEFAGYKSLLTTNHDLDSYDLVITPTFLRPDERMATTPAVQIFHGMSDKPFTCERDFSDYLLCLCIGQRQVDRLLQHDYNRVMKWALVGYPKFDHPSSFSKLFHNDKKTIIYCPTWRKGNLSSIELFLKNRDVVADIVQDYNLIVKPHPNIFNPRRKFFDHEVVRALREMPGIRLAHAGNVMPWFSQSDLYIGDISSSAYEWLYFGRPMIFLNPRPGVLPDNTLPELTHVWQCGEVCDDIRGLKDLIAGNLQDDRFGDSREEVLRYGVYRPRDQGATDRGVRQLEALLRSR